MLKEVANAIEDCSEGERAKLARFSAAQAEEKLSDRPGVSWIFSWLGVVAAGREPNAVSLQDISEDDRMYVRDLSATLEQVVQDQAALDSADTPHDLTVSSELHPVGAVWRKLRRVMQRSLSADEG